MQTVAPFSPTFDGNLTRLSKMFFFFPNWINHCMMQIWQFLSTCNMSTKIKILFDIIVLGFFFFIKRWNLGGCMSLTLANQVSIHVGWNSWPQGICLTFSPFWNDLRQIGQLLLSPSMDLSGSSLIASLDAGGGNLKHFSFECIILFVKSLFMYVTQLNSSANIFLGYCLRQWVRLSHNSTELKWNAIKKAFYDTWLVYQLWRELWEHYR